ncbi:FG-GAP repeat domain-containing protein, partial [Acidobacteriota bacterium]
MPERTMKATTSTNIFARDGIAILLFIGFTLLWGCGSNDPDSTPAQPRDPGETGNMPPAGSTSAASPAERLQFVDVASEIGIDLKNMLGNPGPKPYIVESMGSGIGFLDYDGDQDMDLYLVNGATFEEDMPDPPPRNALYRNNGDGTFTDVTEASGAGDTGWGGGLAIADFDNDYDPDIFLANIGPDVLLRNNGNGTFTDISKQAGIDDPGYGSSTVFVDYDQDGYLDLYVSNYVDFNWDDPPEHGKNNALCQWHAVEVYCGPRPLPKPPDILYRNRGDGTFEDVSEKSGIRSIEPCYGLGVVSGDLDEDGWPDIYVANDATPNFFFHNNGDGTFTEMGLEAGVSHSDRGKEQAGMGVDIGDYNNDGKFDIFVTNYSEDTYALYRNEGMGFFVNLAFESKIADLTYIHLGWGTGFIDIDNNGLFDLFCANGHVYPQADLLTADTGMTYLQ